MSLVSCFFFIGIVRYTFAFPLSSSDISHLDGKKLEFTGTVSSEPDDRSDSIRYIASLEGEKMGNVYFKSSRYPRYEYGDKISLYCTVRKPEPVEDFRYDMYLATQGVFATCENPKITLIAKGEGSFLFSNIYRLKGIVAKRISLLWHEPHASFMAGLLYGYRGGLGKLNDLFSTTGVTHIVAISGYNISLIATLLQTFCLSLVIPRKKAFWITITVIFLFVIFAGLSASVVRAGIMGVLVLLSKQMGRRSRIGNVLAATAVIMVFHNPFILLYDAGFQLSFLSTMGLVYLSPHLEPYLKKVPEALGIRDSLTSTLAATLITLPLILSQFGRLSLVSIPVNMLILWIIPFLMALGFFAVVFSFVLFPVGQLVAWIGWAGLQYIIIIVTWFASLSFAAIDFQIPSAVMIALYGVFVFFLCKKKVDRTRM